MTDSFRNLSGQVIKVQEDLSALRQDVKDNRTDISKIQQDTVFIYQVIEKLERRLEKLDSATRERNLIFFGVYEPSYPDDWTDVGEVVGVLNYFSSGRRWHETDIDKAFRIGRGERRNSRRPLIVTFMKTSDRLSILRNADLRNRLRQEGIRVAADLTMQQRTQQNLQFAEDQIKPPRRKELHDSSDKDRPHHQSGTQDHQQTSTVLPRCHEHGNSCPPGSHRKEPARPRPDGPHHWYNWGFNPPPPVPFSPPPVSNPRSIPPFHDMMQWPPIWTSKNICHCSASSSPHGIQTTLVQETRASPTSVSPNPTQCPPSKRRSPDLQSVHEETRREKQWEWREHQRQEQEQLLLNQLRQIERERQEEEELEAHHRQQMLRQQEQQQPVARNQKSHLTASQKKGQQQVHQRGSDPPTTEQYTHKQRQVEQHTREQRPGEQQASRQHDTDRRQTSEQQEKKEHNFEQCPKVQSTSIQQKLKEQEKKALIVQQESDQIAEQDVPDQHLAVFRSRDQQPAEGTKDHEQQTDDENVPFRELEAAESEPDHEQGTAEHAPEQEVEEHVPDCEQGAAEHAQVYEQETTEHVPEKEPEYVPDCEQETADYVHNRAQQAEEHHEQLAAVQPNPEARKADRPLSRGRTKSRAGTNGHESRPRTRHQRQANQQSIQGAMQKLLQFKESRSREDRRSRDSSTEGGTTASA